jgi:hypothetical protein
MGSTAMAPSPLAAAYTAAWIAALCERTAHWPLGGLPDPPRAQDPRRPVLAPLGGLRRFR